MIHIAGGRSTGSFFMTYLFALPDAKRCAQAARKDDRHTDSSRGSQELVPDERIA
jgi:hypothetical protein